jgi:hypothetical protein
MLWDEKYQPRMPVIICPVCLNLLKKEEWDEFGMHFHCTEYYISGRYTSEKTLKKNEQIGVLTMVE